MTILPQANHPRSRNSTLSPGNHSTAYVPTREGGERWFLKSVA
jgi:hypothetical protein